MKLKHRPFVIVTSSLCAGIIAYTLAPGTLTGAGCLAVLGLLMSIMLPLRKTISTILLCLSIAGMGAVYSWSRQHVGPDHINFLAKYYRAGPATIRGTVISDITRRNTPRANKRTYTVYVDEVQAKWGWEKSSGKILVNSFNDSDIAYGDRIQVKGRLHRPYNFSTDNNFSYRSYLGHRGIAYLLSVKKEANSVVIERNQGNAIKAASLKIRDTLKAVLSRHLSKNEAGIMTAILLGDRSGIVKPVRDLFVQTGTAHILAISGLHIGVVAGLFLLCSKYLPVPRRWQLTSVIILLMFYAFLTGGRPSVVRATIMMSVFLASLIIEREPDALNTLFFAALLILTYNPSNLFDVGFQLSFVCVFSIVYASLHFSKKKNQNKTLFDGRLEQLVGRSLFMSLVIWIAVAGLIAYYFGIITPVTIVANLLVIPLISVIVALGFGLLIVAGIYPPWCFMFAACLKLVLNIMVGGIFLFDKIPLAYIYVGPITLWHVIPYYLGLILILVYLRIRFPTNTANICQELTK